jgi:acyl-CoA thioesterase-1
VQTQSCKDFRHFMQSFSRRYILSLLAGALFLSAVRLGHAVEPFTIVAFGDSLTAGYGLPPEEAFTTQLEASLKTAGLSVRVVNAGVSGDTTKAGLARLDWSVPDGTGLVVLELGANDALRGIAPSDTHANLEVMISGLKQRNIPVLLAGMLAPPNMGADYEAAFNAIYPKLASKHDVPLYPFFLAGVASNPLLNQADGIHPNAQGTMVIVKQLAPVVVKLVRLLQR